jgi:hypothetical protein
LILPSPPQRPKFLKIKNPLIIKGFFVVFADWTGLEPATSAVTGRHSNQLNYQSVLFFGLLLHLAMFSFPQKDCKNNAFFANRQVRFAKNAKEFFSPFPISIFAV